MHYNGFRTYDPVTGRYTQGNPIGLNGGWNRFEYVEGAALEFIDSSGLQAIKDLSRRPTDLSVFEGGAGGGGAIGGGGSASPFGSVGARPSGGRIVADGVGSPVDRFLQITQPGPMTVNPIGAKGTRITGVAKGGGTSNLRLNNDGTAHVDLHTSDSCQITEHWN